MIVKDAETGYSAKIDQQHRILTKAISIPEVAHISADEQESYNATIGPITFNSTNEHPLLYLQNKDNDLYLILSTITYSWNGGDTNHNRAMTKKFYKNPPMPTANYEESLCSNTNFTSNNSSNANCYRWDESTSDGMDIDLTNSENISTDIISPYIGYDGIEAWRLGFNNSLLVSFKPEEIGVAAISLKYYFIN